MAPAPEGGSDEHKAAPAGPDLLAQREQINKELALMARREQDVEETFSIDVGTYLPHIELSRYDVNSQKRKIRDKFCLVLFVIYWLLVLCVCVFSWSQGKPRRLSNGVDPQGYICGYDNGAGFDLTSRPAVWWPNPTLSNSFFCVTACPSATQLAAATAANTTLSFCNYVSNDVSCYPVTYASVNVANRCLPVSGQNINVLGLSGDSISQFTSDLISGIVSAALLLTGITE